MNSICDFDVNNHLFFCAAYVFAYLGKPFDYTIEIFPLLNELNILPVLIYCLSLV